MTSISFETGMTGENAAVKFEVISRAEADRIKEHFRGALLKEEKSPSAELLQSEVSANRVVHFKPTKKELLHASFTSLSFLVFIPLLGSLYFKFNDLINIEEKTKGVFLFIRDSSWIIALLIILLIVASVLFGITRMFFKYGKCEISSDENYIYITKGLVELTTFSISKTKVQAIEINQSIVKRLFGLAEIKLICASSNLGTEQMEVSSLYPFISFKRAYEMISEILPSYEITKKMLHLPKKSFIVRMLKPSWFWMIATAVLFYFKPVVLDFDFAWWILSVALLVWIVILRILDYINTRYVLNNQFFQFKTGSLTTTLFVSKREKVVEVNVTQNLLQRLFGLASIGTINRAKPIQHSRITDVPSELAMIFQNWYLGRKNEVRLEGSSEEHESNRRIR